MERANKDLNFSMRFSTGGTCEVFQSWRAQGRWLEWAWRGDGDRPPGAEADGVGGMSLATCKLPGESRWCVWRLSVAPWEGRRQQGCCWVAPWGDQGGEGTLWGREMRDFPCLGGF